MTTSQRNALVLALATLTAWFGVVSIQPEPGKGRDALLDWNVAVLGLLTVFAAFITAALIAHWTTIDMRPGVRGYLVWRSAGYVRERRQLTRLATHAELPERNPR